jgi:cell fate regulator YaaT (PSP1 superfamily)
MATKSNQEKGEASLRQLAAWLDSAEAIPERHSKANISAIAVAASIERQVLYRPEAKAMIQAAVEEKGLGMPNLQRQTIEDVPEWASRRIHKLEQELAVAHAEIQGLRGRLRDCAQVEEHMVKTGLLPR